MAGPYSFINGVLTISSVVADVNGVTIDLKSTVKKIRGLGGIWATKSSWPRFVKTASREGKITIKKAFTNNQFADLFADTSYPNYSDIVSGTFVYTDSSSVTQTFTFTGRMTARKIESSVSGTVVAEDIEIELTYCVES